MPSALSEPAEDGGRAPTYGVPQKRVVSIEHPMIVHNFDNGFKSLGGEHQLKHVLEHEIGDSKASGVEPVAGVSLRPNDPFAKKLSSTAVATQHVLIKVTLPKRTGRKRKRGSNEPYVESQPLEVQHDSITASELLARLRDNAERYTVEPVGLIQDTHHFQNGPDLQVATDDVPLMRELRDHAFEPDYDRLKRFHVDLQPGWHGITEFPGPPNFIPVEKSYTYEDWQVGEFKENKPVEKKKIIRKIGSSMLETGVSLKTLQEVPQSPPIGTSKPVGKVATGAANALRALLEERPIVTIRAAISILKDHTMKSISQAVQFVGFYVKDGPWSGTIVKFGIDPRKDPKYRIYQTLKFEFLAIRDINAEPKRQGQTGEAHIFDGVNLSEVGKLWQLCDLSDPVLQALTNTTEIRTQCDNERSGWYYNGLIGKLRVLFREKMSRIVNGEPAMEDEICALITALPNNIADLQDCKLVDVSSDYAHQLARDVAKESMQGPQKSYRIIKQLGGGRSYRSYRAIVPADVAAFPDVNEEDDTGEGSDDDDEEALVDGDEDVEGEEE